MRISTPRHTPDLMLAPVQRVIAGRLASLAGLDQVELAQLIAIDTNLIPQSRMEAEQAVLAEVTHLIPTRGWVVTCEPPGVRLRHGTETILLEAPQNVTAFIAGGWADTRVSSR